MQIQIISDLDVLSYPCAAQISEAGFQGVKVKTEDTSTYELRHSTDIRAQDIVKIFEAIHPLKPKAVCDMEMPNGVVELTLGDGATPSHWDVTISADNDHLNTSIQNDLTKLGFRKFEQETKFHKTSHLHLKNATGFMRDCILWIMSHYGVDLVPLEEHEDDDMEISVNFITPQQADLSVEERVPVIVYTDDIRAGKDILSEIKNLGFHDVRLELMDSNKAMHEKFEISVGPLLELQMHDMTFNLLALIGQVATDWGIDPLEYPVTKSEPMSIGKIKGIRVTEESEVHLTLPLLAAKSRALLPYGYKSLECYEVHIFTDDENEGHAVQQALYQNGFPNCELSSLDMDDVKHGVLVKWGLAGRYQDVQSVIDTVMNDEMKRMDLANVPYTKQASFSHTDNDIYIYLPVMAYRMGLYDAEIRSPKNYHIGILGDDASALDKLKETFDTMGFDEVGIQDHRASVDTCSIIYGRAPVPLVDQVSAEIRAQTGHDLPHYQCLSPSSDKILVTLPETNEEKNTPSKESSKLNIVRDSQDEPAELALPTVKPETCVDHLFIRQNDESVWIGEIKLPRRSGRHHLVPPATDFIGYCIDQNTAQTLHHLAVSILMKEPCCLEGDTSTSKTSSIRYLAHLLNQPVYRTNLSGQTDTLELIGKPLPMVGSQGWTWQDGIVIEAMRDGFLILDEVNLASADVLEKLNPVLEKNPRLVRSEYDNSVVGSEEDPISPHFRVFSTQNPSDFSGRSIMSPAWRDRWQGYRIVPSPGEREYANMLHLMISGHQPSVVINGIRYQGEQQQPIFPTLNHLEPYVEAIARVHVSLEHAAASGNLGTQKREKYVFTRRGLTSFIEYMELFGDRLTSDGPEQLVRQALERYYLDKISDPEDRATVQRLIDAVGIQPTQNSEAA